MEVFVARVQLLVVVDSNQRIRSEVKKKGVQEKESRLERDLYVHRRCRWAPITAHGHC